MMTLPDLEAKGKSEVAGARREAIKYVRFCKTL